MLQITIWVPKLLIFYLETELNFFFFALYCNIFEYCNIHSRNTTLAILLYHNNNNKEYKIIFYNNIYSGNYIIFYKLISYCNDR